ncbi:hypothetical protein AVEN_131262-1 [Araneus ventricosus]|uniref:RNase H type-1 domain-containing protein n=1 Tax=Araneus ventricosus TaxID=182803 RepID=A0A4Y2LTF1_ARAVE|nr:hypothetical protein AVEN_131262-1 [Araneus ventricosus]
MNTGTEHEIINKIKDLPTSNPSIKINWLKAHASIQGNELADRLAKKATEKEDTHIPIPKSWIKMKLRNDSRDKMAIEMGQFRKSKAFSRHFSCVVCKKIDLYINQILKPHMEAFQSTSPIDFC